MAPQTPVSPAQHDGMLDKINHIVPKSHRNNRGYSVNGTNGQSLLTSILHNLASQEMRIPEDIGLIVSTIQTEIDGGLIDDKTYYVPSFLLH